MTLPELQSQTRCPSITTDTVLFTIREGGLQVLLVQRACMPFKGSWALPGGFINMGESPGEAALRELREETGATGIYLEQLYTFGKPDRDPRGHVISVAYYALVPADRLNLKAAEDARELAWFHCGHLPTLAFDHQRIVQMALQRLSGKFDYSTIALQFLPEHFTLRELQRVYEITQGRPLDKRNFRKRMLATGCILPTGRRAAGRHRPAELYRVRTPGTVVILK